MPYTAISLVLKGILNTIIMLTMIRVLDMRSNVLFCTLRAAVLVVWEFVRYASPTTVALQVVVSALDDLALPILMSKGSLRSRVVRTSTILLGTMICELLGTSTYTLITGRIAGSVIESGDSDVIFIYLVLITVIAVIDSLIVAFYEHVDERTPVDGSFVIFIGLLPGMFITLYVVYAQLLRYGHNSPLLVAPLFLYSWLALVGCGVVYAVARREAESRLEAAEAALAARGARHTRAEVEALASRARGMESLRHELANDARAVRRLAEAGDVAGADRRLVALQEQARVLNGDNNE